MHSTQSVAIVSDSMESQSGVESRPLAVITIENRHRKDLGDLSGLVSSIERVGLLHPIVVDSSDVLVAGARRYEAVRRLGWDEIPVTVAENLADVRLALFAERDENTERLDMTPSEKVSLGRELEALERPKAAERKARPGQPREEKFSSQEGTRGERTGKVYDLVGEAVGMSGPTYKRAKAVVKAAEDGDPVAQEAQREMDETGKVTPAYKKATNQRPSSGKPSPEQKAREARKEFTADLRGLVKVVSRLEKSVSVQLLTANEKEIGTWMALVSESLDGLDKIDAIIKGEDQ